MYIFIDPKYSPRWQKVHSDYQSPCWQSEKFGQVSVILLCTSFALFRLLYALVWFVLKIGVIKTIIYVILKITFRVRTTRVNFLMSSRSIRSSATRGAGMQATLPARQLSIYSWFWSTSFLRRHSRLIGFREKRLLTS